MTRLAPMSIDDLDDEQRAVLDAINSGPRGGSGGRQGGIGMVGPYDVWVRAPEVGMSIQELGGVARFKTSLDEDVKEVAICVVGAHHHAKFEFAAHARLAAQAGVPDEAIESMRVGSKPELTGALAIAYAVADDLMARHRMTEQTYAAAIEAFGEKGTIELVSIIGYYVLVSLTLNAFQVPLAGAMTDPFPEYD